MLLVLLALAAAPTLSFDEKVIVQISPGYPQPMENCSIGSDWIYLEGAISYSCPSSPMHSIELSGESPVHKELAAPLKRSLRSGAILTAVPMWRVKDAQDACKRGQKTLASVPITATVRCDGAEPSIAPFTVPLELACVSKQPGLKARLEAERRIYNTASLDVGSPGKMKLEVQWSALHPTPVTATVVELDPAGEVANRFMTVPPRKDDQQSSFEVTRDTSKERTTQLGLELKFDGHVALKPMKIVFISPKDEGGVEGIKAFGKVFTDGAAVLNRLSAAIKDPCSRPDEALAFLRAQPEVTFAENHEKTLSFSIGRQSFPVHCGPLLR